jgi:hypothetical protein
VGQAAGLPFPRAPRLRTQVNRGTRDERVWQASGLPHKKAAFAMTARKVSVVREPDEVAAPLVFLYIFGVIVWLFTVIAWVFWFRGYA